MSGKWEIQNQKKVKEFDSVQIPVTSRKKWWVKDLRNYEGKLGKETATLPKLKTS